MAEAYRAWLLETELPKLFFWAEPGALISPRLAAWLQTRLKACKSVDVYKRQRHHRAKLVR